ncbi:MAG: hypothetical protein COV60_00110 [Candidatus Magasanikbacteria bacterium CG11_big_fil_rev_8_21_14_0_20_43_7]|uniref:Uncharacterized protein n=1 Tax=Candidatus Magasanikbacteria bacterium CG11_big_fil_rev_8_21_14_0_20_43_7 TaxID=1974654 RepID=A0A2H0N3L3_9BACT|nr:MAG: hypothetical protein COV60_00110 [Candidatus Magasanikbacteria bacterium CG11_big_fil_rev_8_21_14_0_20_43_7]
MIELNDTLQLTRAQGFPEELVYETHLAKPFDSIDFKGKLFSFFNKDNIRIFQAPPIRNFLVQNIDGKWIYWGLVHIIETHHDTLQQTTSGTFEIIHIYTPEEMEMAYRIIDRRDGFDFFNKDL